MKEIWKDIKDYENHYQISNFGNIKSLKDGKGKMLKLKKGKNGYLYTNLSKNGKVKTYTVHKLVAQTFILNPENKPEIDHINTVRNDNRVENLRWVTRKENNNNLLTKEKMSNAHEGKKLSEECKKKLSEIRKGLNNPTARAVVCLENGIVYSTITQCAEELGLSTSNITKVCRKKRRATGGYHFKYEEGGNENDISHEI